MTYKNPALQRKRMAILGFLNINLDRIPPLEDVESRLIVRRTSHKELKYVFALAFAVSANRVLGCWLVASDEPSVPP